jgi:hypothetical protein
MSMSCVVVLWWRGVGGMWCCVSVDAYVCGIGVPQDRARVLSAERSTRHGRPECSSLRAKGVVR